MGAKLQILSGKKQGAIFELPEGADIDIGNRKSAKLSIRDPWISYNHAKISGQDGRFFIEDLGSSNGTWINGEKIKRHELSPNVLIYFGKTKVKFLSGGAVVTEDELGSQPDETPWWDKVLDDTSGRKAGGGARARRLEAELREERRMRQALEKFLGVPQGTAIGDATKAGELEQKIAELQKQLSEGGGGGASAGEVEEAVAAERARGEKLRRDQMTKIVELEGSLSQAEAKVVDLEGRLKDKNEQVKKEIGRAKEKMQAEQEELKTALEEARRSASEMASGGDQALAAAREQSEKLEKELDELRARAHAAEGKVDTLERELRESQEQASKAAEGGEKLETLKSQLWAAVEEATKLKEEVVQLQDELDAARAEADKWRDEHAQIVQEIDEISMEQIDVEEELNQRIEQLEGLLQEKGIDVPAAPQPAES